MSNSSDISKLTPVTFIQLSNLCGSNRGFQPFYNRREPQIYCGFLQFHKYFLAGGRLRLSRGRWRNISFDYGKYGSFTVFALYLRFPKLLCGCRTAENRGFARNLFYCCSHFKKSVRNLWHLTPAYILKLYTNSVNMYRVAQKSKPLPNDQKIVVKPVNEIGFIRQIKV